MWKDELARVATLGSLITSLSGCSFLFTTSPPKAHEQLPPLPAIDCTTSKVAPVLDTVGATLQIVGVAVAAGGTQNQDSEDASNRNIQIGLGVAWAALLVGSAAYGYSVTSDCKEAKELQAQRLYQLLQRQTAPAQAAPVQAAPAQTATPPASAAPVVPAPPPRACTPGTTQECVGPGACRGGHACLADGSAYDVCDCGEEEEAPEP